MDYPLLLFTFLLFLIAVYVGHREYRRLVDRWPDASLTNFHLKPGWVRFVLLFLIILMGPSLYLVIVDHPAAGKESHAVVAVKYDAEKKTLEIWNPLSGSEFMTRTELKRIWSGHGIACQKTAGP